MSIDEYRRINKSFKRVLIFKIGLNSGFFSEYNNMILAMLYCLENRIQFKLSSNGANFNTQFGWNGYFDSFCDSVVDNRLHYRTLDWRYSLKLVVKRFDRLAVHSLFSYMSFWKKELLTQDVFGKCRDKLRYRKRHVIPELGFRGSTQEICSMLVCLTWKYNDSTNKRIKEILKTLSLPDKN